MVPVMAGCYLLITLFVIIKNIGAVPSVFRQIFEEAFGIRQVAAGGFGAVLMNGIKRGLFSNEAAAALHLCRRCRRYQPSGKGRPYAGIRCLYRYYPDLYLFRDADAAGSADKINGLQGMDLLQSAMQYHLGEFGVIFIA